MEEKSFRMIIREEWKKLSALPWRQRFGYIWDYYKPLMAAIIVLILLISLGVTIYQNLQINHILNVYLINSNPATVDAETIAADFAEYIGGIGKKDEVLIDTSITLDQEDVSQFGMANQMKLTAVASSGEMDVVLFDRTGYETYRDGGGLRNLSEILTEEQLVAWSEYLEYGADPESGEEVPMGLNVQNAPLIQKYQAYNGGEVFAVMLANAQHTEMGAKFFAYLLEGIL